MNNNKTIDNLLESYDVFNIPILNSSYMSDLKKKYELLLLEEQNLSTEIDALKESLSRVENKR